MTRKELKYLAEMFQDLYHYWGSLASWNLRAHHADPITDIETMAGRLETWKRAETALRHLIDEFYEEDFLNEELFELEDPRDDDHLQDMALHNFDRLNQIARQLRVDAHTGKVLP